MLEPSDKPKYIQVYEMHKAGYTRKEIRVFMGLSAHTVSSYISRGANPEHFRKVSRAYAVRYLVGPRDTAWSTMKDWTEAQLCERLTTLWGEGFSAGKIATMVPFRGHFTRNAIIGKANRLGLVGKGKRKTPSVKLGHAFPRGPKEKMWEVEL
jgi:hypothetical protein